MTRLLGAFISHPYHGSGPPSSQRVAPGARNTRTATVSNKQVQEAGGVGGFVAGLILAGVAWGSGAIAGDILWVWYRAVMSWEMSQMHVADAGVLGALAFLVIAVVVGLFVALPLAIVAFLVSVSAKYYVLPILAFLLGFSPLFRGFGRRTLGGVGNVLMIPISSGFEVLKHRTWRARLSDLSVFLVFLAIVGGVGFVIVRSAMAPASLASPVSLFAQRPVGLTPEWHGTDSPNVRAYVQSVSIQPASMAVTLRFENRGSALTRLMFTNKLEASGARGAFGLEHEQLTSTTAADGGVPLRPPPSVVASNAMAGVVQIPPGSFREGTYYFSCPKRPRAFWEVNFRWAETTSFDPNVGWVPYLASASFDLREQPGRGSLFSISPEAVRKAVFIPSGHGGVRW